MITSLKTREEGQMIPLITKAWHTVKHGCWLTELPDLPLIKILYFIDIEILIKNVRLVCKRLNHIIKTTPILWRIIEFKTTLYIDEDVLKYITRYATMLSVFDIGYSQYKCDVAFIDSVLISRLSLSKNLVSLNLTTSPISSLCFLKDMTNLESLELSRCKNLQDCDFIEIGHCIKLEVLYLAFDSVSGKTLKHIVHSTSCLDMLDIFGVYLTTTEINGILNECYSSLSFFYVSLVETEEEEVFDKFMHDNYIDLHYRMRRFSNEPN